jgi:hypothetical protein
MAAASSAASSADASVDSSGASSGWRRSISSDALDAPEYWPRWAFGQCFGDRDATEEFSEADVLSAVEFDPTGEYLASGDKGGRVVVFKRADENGEVAEPVSVQARTCERQAHATECVKLVAVLQRVFAAAMPRHTGLALRLWSYAA